MNTSVLIGLCFVLLIVAFVVVMVTIDWDDDGSDED